MFDGMLVYMVYRQGYISTGYGGVVSKILVVGGAGYIGSHMVLALQDAGYPLLVFDNLSRGYEDAVGSAPLVVGDLRNPLDLDRVFATQHIDLVLHFAALAYVGESVTDPELYYQNNVTGTLLSLIHISEPTRPY